MKTVQVHLIIGTTLLFDATSVTHTPTLVIGYKCQVLYFQFFGFCNSVQYESACNVANYYRAAKR